MPVVDALVAYKFIKQLTTPWEKWDAYKLGLIDKKGQTIKKAETGEEKSALPTWKVLVKNIKKTLDKLPGGATKLGSFAVALWLLKEEMGITNQQILEDAFTAHVESRAVILNEDSTEMVNTLEKGRYVHRATGDAVFLKQNYEAVGSMLNTPIFEVSDFVSGRTYTITADELERF